MYRMLSRTFYQSPKLVCAYLLSCRTSVVPMTRTFLEEGVSDGSTLWTRLKSRQRLMPSLPILLLSLCL